MSDLTSSPAVSSEPAPTCPCGAPMPCSCSYQPQASEPTPSPAVSAEAEACGTACMAEMNRCLVELFANPETEQAFDFERIIQSTIDSARVADRVTIERLTAALEVATSGDDVKENEALRQTIARLESELAEAKAEIVRLKQRVTVTHWNQPGVQTLILKGGKEETLATARDHFGSDPCEEEILSGREGTMTNAELETLEEWGG